MPVVSLHTSFQHALLSYSSWEPGCELFMLKILNEELQLVHIRLLLM